MDNFPHPSIRDFKNNNTNSEKGTHRCILVFILNAFFSPPVLSLLLSHSAAALYLPGGTLFFFDLPLLRIDDYRDNSKKKKREKQIQKVMSASPPGGYVLLLRSQSLCVTGPRQKQNADVQQVMTWDAPPPVDLWGFPTGESGYTGWTPSLKANGRCWTE